MSRIRLYINFLIALITSTAAVFLSSCKETPEEGMIIVTQIAGDLQNNDYITGNSWRYFPDSRLVALNTTKSGTTLKILTEDFFSACSPAISYDGKYMLFAAQKRQNDIWQLWEMNLKNLKVRQIMSSTDNCIDPAYLPDGRLVFSKFSMNDTAKRGHPLYTCNLDGSEISQITYNPHAYFASSVLFDGRVLAISRELYPDQRDGMLMILRPDGSKEEMFYQGLNGSDLHSRARETNNGTIIFIERDRKNTEGGNIISVNYNSPLHTRENLSSEIKGDFYNASPVNTDRLLVSYRAPDEARYGLYEFDSKNKQLGKVIYKDQKYNVLEALSVKKKERPKKLPSELNMTVKTGLLLCQDINFLDMQSEENKATNEKAVSIELMGIDTSLGIVDVEKDGSIYLKLLADIPFRIRTIDAYGQVVNGPGSWIYVRPNERRGCVGCHEDNEQVPENRQPLSVKKDPVILPVQLKEIQKKQVD